MSRELWARYRAGESLSDAESDALLTAFRSDSELRRELVKDVHLDGLLHARALEREDGEPFVENVADYLRNEADGAAFVRQVEERIQRKRRRPRKAAGRPVWPIFLAAAAALLAISAAVFYEQQLPEPISPSPDPVVTVPPPEPTKPLDAPVPEMSPAERQRRIEEAMRREIEKNRVTFDPPKPKPQKPVPAPVPVVTPRPRKPAETKVVAAQLKALEGTVLVAGRPATAGMNLIAGEGLRTREKSTAALVYPDGTTVTLDGETTVTALRSSRVTLAAGSVRAEVEKRDADHALVVSTPQADLTVLGTVLRVTVGSSTRLEVESGKVRLTRKSDGKSLDVPGGSYAVAAESGTLALRETALPARLVEISLMDERGRDPLPGYDMLHAGAVFNLADLPSRKFAFRARTFENWLPRVTFELVGDEAAFPAHDHTPQHRGYPTRINSLEWAARAGTFTLRATPYSGTGVAGAPMEIPFTVLDDPSLRVVHLQDGVSPNGAYAGTRDTSIWSVPPDGKNLGTEAELYLSGEEPGVSGRDRASLLRWDLSNVDSDGTLVAAGVSFFIWQDSGGVPYHVYGATRAWSEREATWTDAAAGVPWEHPGARGGNDRVLATIAPRQWGAAAVSLNKEGLARVRGWLRDPGSNHGLLIAHPTSKVKLEIASRETRTPYRRPRLTLVFRN